MLIPWWSKGKESRKESGVFRKVIKKVAIGKQAEGMDRLIRGQKKKTLKPETSWGKLRAGRGQTG